MQFSPLYLMILGSALMAIPFISYAISPKKMVKQRVKPARRQGKR